MLLYSHQKFCVEFLQKKNQNWGAVQLAIVTRRSKFGDRCAEQTTAPISRMIAKDKLPSALPKVRVFKVWSHLLSQSLWFHQENTLPWNWRNSVIMQVSCPLSLQALNNYLSAESNGEKAQTFNNLDQDALSHGPSSISLTHWMMMMDDTVFFFCFSVCVHSCLLASAFVLFCFSGFTCSGYVIHTWLDLYQFQ